MVMKRRESQRMPDISGADIITAWGVFVAALACLVIVPLAL
jgi:hypothetical protein